MNDGQYVQYGCGWSAPKEWRNFDASLTLRFERLPLIGHLYTKNESRFPGNVEYGDIVKGLPIPPGRRISIVLRNSIRKSLSERCSRMCEQ